MGKLSENVRILRERMGLSQSELGKLIGKTHTTINKLEIEKTANPRYVKQLAEIFGVSEAELRFGEFCEKSDKSFANKPDYGMRIIEERLI